MIITFTACCAKYPTPSYLFQPESSIPSWLLFHPLHPSPVCPKACPLYLLSVSQTCTFAHGHCFCLDLGQHGLKTDDGNGLVSLPPVFPSNSFPIPVAIAMILKCKPDNWHTPVWSFSVAFLCPYEPGAFHWILWVKTTMGNRLLGKLMSQHPDLLFVRF